MFRIYNLPQTIKSNFYLPQFQIWDMETILELKKIGNKKYYQLITKSLYNV